MPWTVSSLTRGAAGEVPKDAEGREVYGGTPSDQAVVEAILALRQAGQDVLYYPFILMEQMPATACPTRGATRAISRCCRGAGGSRPRRRRDRTGSPDGTAAAEAEVAAFFGTAQASDFTVTPVAAVPVGEPGTGALDLLSYGGAVKSEPGGLYWPR